MVVDTSAIVAILLAEPEAAQFKAAVGGGKAVISAASYVELAMVTLGRNIVGRLELDTFLSNGRINIVPVSVTQAHLAADAFTRFGKGRHPAGLNYGDCFAYALAKERGEPLLFKGCDFARTDIELAA